MLFEGVSDLVSVFKVFFDGVSDLVLVLKFFVVLVILCWF